MFKRFRTIITSPMNDGLVTHGRQVIWLYPGLGRSHLPQGFALEYLILLFFLFPSENWYHFFCSHCEKQSPGFPSLETEVWFLSEASSISDLCRLLWNNPGERWALDLQVSMKGAGWPGAAEKPPWTSWLKGFKFEHNSPEKPFSKVRNALRKMIWSITHRAQALYNGLNVKSVE